MRFSWLWKWTRQHVASACRLPVVCGFLVLCGGQAVSHPHVFVDGGVSFEFNDSNLTALHVTWLYDDFETLYILSSHNLSLNAEGGLDEVDRRALVRYRSNWPSDFDGSAHLSVDGKPVSLQWPEDLDAQIIDGRLQITYTRALSEPVGLAGLTADVAFYESTYFFAFAVTKQPELAGAEDRCSADVIKYDPTVQDQELQATLFKLSREQTPDVPNVGAMFADRIVVTCG